MKAAIACKALDLAVDDSPRESLVHYLQLAGIEIVTYIHEANIVYILPSSDLQWAKTIKELCVKQGKAFVYWGWDGETLPEDDTTGVTTFEDDEDEDDILEEALRLTTGPRINAYGPPTQDFRRSAGMLNIIFENKLKEGQKFLPHEIALIVNCIKLSRLSWSPERRDSWVDTAGYARCGWICVQEELDNGEL